MTREPRAWGALFGAPVEAADPQLARLLADEEARQAGTVNLIASESYAFRAALEAEASLLVDKNASGYPGRREVAGCEVVDAVERLAVERAKRVFGAEHANVQALSSTVANVAVLRALLPPRGRILALDSLAGGHHSHGARHHVSGQDYEVVTFGLDETSGGLDLAAAREAAEWFEPHLVVAGSTAYPRAIDFRGLGRIAGSVGAMLFADVAHVAGLVVAGLHENPTPYADVVTTSTHKTLCGPRTGGLVLSKARHAAAIDAALFPGIQGAPGAHIIAGRAVLLDLVAREPFRELMRAVVANARALAGALAGHGLALYAGGTDTHMVVVDLRGGPIDGEAAERALEAHGIVSNRVALPARARDGGRAGLRLGTVAMTIRGMDARAFETVAEAVAALLRRRPGSPVDLALGRRMAALARAHPMPAGMTARGSGGSPDGRRRGPARAR